MKEPICITAISSVSPLGISLDDIWAEYQNPHHLFSRRKFDEKEEWIAPLSGSGRLEIDELKNSDPKYKNLDDSVRFAIFAARRAVGLAGWKPGDNFGINIGSSRGATSLFEKYHEEYIRTQKTSTLASPTTTLGNISSWVAHDLGSQGPEISHSITCSTALHALLNGVSWLRSGMADKFMAGGSEAPLTPFTIAQMKALKIYSGMTSIEQSVGFLGKRENTGMQSPVTERSRSYPCRAMEMDKSQNTMILGEGASVVCLEKGKPRNALAHIAGLGYATEILEHNISISKDAECFQRSMKMALGDRHPSEVDVIVLHAPGTVKGDLSEFRAVQKVFGRDIPALTTNKWKIGHTFGASGMLSIELALLMLKHQEFVKVPFVDYISVPKKIGKIMVNAVGFGGNAVSILLGKI